MGVLRDELALGVDFSSQELAEKNLPELVGCLKTLVSGCC